jgi:hypothetical protein
MEPVPPLCLHCERRRRSQGLVLCSRCNARKLIRQLYVRRRGWTPQWEAHLRRLTARARSRLPLFDNDPPAQEPPIRSA